MNTIENLATLIAEQQETIVKLREKLQEEDERSSRFYKWWQEDAEARKKAEQLVRQHEARWEDATTHVANRLDELDLGPEIDISGMKLENYQEKEV